MADIPIHEQLAAIGASNPHGWDAIHPLPDCRTCVHFADYGGPEAQECESPVPCINAGEYVRETLPPVRLWQKT